MSVFRWIYRVVSGLAIWSDKADPWGLYADQVVETTHQRDRIAELEAALLPFADLGAIICPCAGCQRGTLVVKARRGEAIICNSDFSVASAVLKGERANIPEVQSK